MSLLKFLPKDVAIICPTKNQPTKVLKLLESIQLSSVIPAQIIIADGGKNLKPVLKRLEKVLNIYCLYCPVGGQILQRNLALNYLDSSIRLVIFLDDDIILSKNAIRNILSYWNNKQKDLLKPLAGVSFNIVNATVPKSSIFRNLFFLNSEPRGSVSKGGYASPYCPATENHDVEWVLGGATAWSRDIVDKYKHPINFPTRWAVCEDLMFSYPLLKNYRLAVVKNADVYHIEENEGIDFPTAVFKGLSSVIMRYFFVCQNPNLSSLAFCWMTIGVLIGNFILGVRGSNYHLGLFVGGLKGFVAVLLKFRHNDKVTEMARGLAQFKSIQ